MGWRSLMISRPAKLKREHFSLAIEQEETAHVPFEDIAVIILNHREILLTHPVLSACAEYGIALYATGDNHQPSGVFLPFLQHTRTTRLMRKQMAIGKPLIKQAWALIIKQKIENQARCLTLAGKEGAETLQWHAARIRSGDPENLEGQAAAFYFPALFGKGFYRGEMCPQNSALDYGYAVLRGAIARGLVAHGLHPPIGIFHGSEQNAFNLADDVIEPFRPVVDLHVAKTFFPTNADLSPNDKAALVALLNVDVGMGKGVMSVLSAVEYAVESVARLFEHGDAALDLPRLLGLKTHRLDY